MITNPKEQRADERKNGGLNRQIRRMCYKLGYEVLALKRIRIVNVKLENLQVGEWRKLRKEEVEELKSLVS